MIINNKLSDNRLNSDIDLAEVKEFCASYISNENDKSYKNLVVKEEPKFNIFSDIVIIGDGLGGSIMSTYLSSKSIFKIINVRPKKRTIHSAYSLSKEEISNLKCIFSKEELDEVISSIDSKGYFTFYDDSSPTQDDPNYVSLNVLDHEINIEAFYDSLDEKFLKNNGKFHLSKYSHVKRFNNYNYVYTEDGEIIKTRLIISALGENDPFNKLANPKENLLYACTYGAIVKLKENKLPKADILRTIDNSDNGIQYLYELFKKDDSDYSVIYVFYIDSKKADFVDLYNNKFIDQVEKYTGSQIIEIEKLLYGNIPLSKDLINKKRSAFDGHYLFGSLCGISPNSACGTQMFRYLDSVGSQLIESLKNNQLKRNHLNKIKPDRRQLLSWSLEGLFTNFMRLNDGEHHYTPNDQLKFTFKQFSRISDVKKRNDLLKAIFKPDVLGEMVIKTSASGHGLQYLTDIAKNNGGFFKLWLTLNSIMTSYIKEEFREILKHKSLISDPEKDKSEVIKEEHHKETLEKSKRINLIKPMIKHALFYFNPFRKTT